jgi:hypothetical protein
MRKGGFQIRPYRTPLSSLGPIAEVGLLGRSPSPIPRTVARICGAKPRKSSVAGTTRSHGRLLAVTVLHSDLARLTCRGKVYVWEFTRTLLNTGAQHTRYGLCAWHIEANVPPSHLFQRCSATQGQSANARSIATCTRPHRTYVGFGFSLLGIVVLRQYLVRRYTRVHSVRCICAKQIALFDHWSRYCDRADAKSEDQTEEGHPHVSSPAWLRAEQAKLGMHNTQGHTFVFCCATRQTPAKTVSHRVRPSIPA